MKRMVTLTCTGIVAWALLAPQQATAGNSEWATAGKILTGLLAAQVLTNGFDCAPRSRRVHVVEERIVYRPKVIVERWVVEEPRVIVEERIVYRTYPSTHIEIRTYGSGRGYHGRGYHGRSYHGRSYHSRHGRGHGHYRHGCTRRGSSHGLSIHSGIHSSRAHDISRRITGHTVRRVH